MSSTGFASLVTRVCRVVDWLKLTNRSETEAQGAKTPLAGFYQHGLNVEDLKVC